MAIQAINSSDLIQSPIRTDFQNFRKSFRALENAMKSGNQDQVTLSENFLQQAMTQFQTDVSSLQKGQGQNGSGGPEGHHHHHHHQVHATNSSSNTNNLLSYLAAALGYGSSGQSQNTDSGTGLKITT